MINRDKRTDQEILDMITFLGLPEGSFWANTVESVSGLRKNFSKIWGSMQKSKPAVNAEANKDWVKKYKKIMEQRPDIRPGYDYIEFVNGPKVIETKFGDKNFKEVVEAELRRRKLIVSGVANET
jgi:hypothetical protein